MSEAPKVSNKHILIDKANAIMLVTVGITAFIVTFSLVASKALISQSRYQAKVIKEKDITLKQLKENNNNVSKLVESYKSFAGEKVNILEGSISGTGSRDGDNPKIVLDALPSKYDFPGLISSVEKLLKEGGYKIINIGGSDDEIAQQKVSTAKPTAIQIPFPISVETNYQGAQNLLLTLERTIRPIQVSSLNITASGSVLQVAITAKTFYQPEKSLNISSKVVK